MFVGLGQFDKLLPAEFELYGGAGKEVEGRGELHEFEGGFEYCFCEEEGGAVAVEGVVIECELGEVAADVNYFGYFLFLGVSALLDRREQFPEGLSLVLLPAGVV